MKKKIAIFTDFSKKSGGAFHEASYLSREIIKNSLNDYEFLIIKPKEQEPLDLGSLNVPYLNFDLNEIDRFINFSRNYNSFVRRIKKYFFFKNKFENFLKKNDIELVFFPGPSQYSLYLEDTNYLITVPDICHRENIGVPEWTNNGEFLRREELLKNSLPRALAVITNAESIKKNLVHFYGLMNSRVFVINQQPSLNVKNFEFDTELNTEFKTKFKLPDNYLFYPAMYLPQKNHKYIMDTIKILNQKHNFDMSAVFCGVDKGYLSDLKNYCSSVDMNKKTFFLNFVESKFLPYLYRDSFAVCMPTLSGPTNLPVWESFKMKKLVFYSNLEHSKEIYGDGPCYINPLDVNSLVESIIFYYKNPKLKDEKIIKGFEKFDKNNFENEIKVIKNTFKEYFQTKKIWSFK